MTPDKLSNQRLAAVFVLGGILFNHPILSLFDRPVTWGGVPLLYIYLFLLWALLIGVIRLIAHRGASSAVRRRNPDADH
jgi:hypothetical protein